MKYRAAILASIACVMLTSCSTNPALKEGKELIANGQSELGVLRMEEAIRLKPDDHDARLIYFRERDVVIARLVAEADAARFAGRYPEAEALYARVQLLDANNVRVRSGRADIAAAQRHDAILKEAEALVVKNDASGAEQRLRNILNENTNHAGAREMLSRLQAQSIKVESAAQALKSPFSKPITLEFRDTPLKSVFEVISRSSGINFVFDKDLRPDLKVTIFVRNSSIEDVIKLILVSNQLERKMLNENSVLIYPNTPAKNKDYQELVTKSFYFSNTEVKQAQALIKTMVKTRDIFIDEKLNMMIIKDTPDAIRMAERLIESLDLAEPEVVLDVEVIEVSRGKLLELGVRFPDQVGYGLLSSSGDATTVYDASGNLVTTTQPKGSSLAPGVVNLFNKPKGLRPYVTNPALLLNLRDEAGDSNLLANPRIRVKNREKAKIHIGDKLPVFTTTSTANVGVSASVTYLDVGLKLDVEPSVQLDDEVTIKIGMEVSSIVKEIPGPSNSLAYQIGTRSAATVLRLKNGETQVLAGLISEEERSTANRLPGLGDLPVLGRLFSSQKDSRNKTEIVLLITPRIVRNIARPDSASFMQPSGTDTSIGAAPLRINAPKSSLSMSGSTGATGGMPPRPEMGAMPGMTMPGAEGEEPSKPDNELQVEAPERVQLGTQFGVFFNMNAPAGFDVKTAGANISYDPSALEWVGADKNAAPGNAHVTVVSNPSGGLRGEIQFRAKGKEPARTALQIGMVANLPDSKDAVQISPSASVTIELAR